MAHRLFNKTTYNQFNCRHRDSLRTSNPLRILVPARHETLSSGTDKKAPKLFVCDGDATFTDLFPVRTLGHWSHAKSQWGILLGGIQTAKMEAVEHLLLFPTFPLLKQHSSCSLSKFMHLEVDIPLFFAALHDIRYHGAMAQDMQNLFWWKSESTRHNGSRLKCSANRILRTLTEAGSKRGQND